MRHHLHGKPWMTPEERFWSAVEKTETCWNWTKSTRAGGYGQINFNGKYDTSHRVSWLIHNGEIPKDKMVLHRCHNRGCVRPSHLYLGNARLNRMDCIFAGRYHDNYEIINARKGAKK